MLTYDDADLRRAAAAAVRAPSLYNSQPWRFRLRDGAIEVLADPARQLTVADSTGWAVRIACGAATCNARLALAAAGTPAQVLLRPDRAQPELLARLTPGPRRPPTYTESELASAIPRRHSNRQPFWPDPVPPTESADSGWSKRRHRAGRADGSQTLRQTSASSENAREIAGGAAWTDYTVSARVKPLVVRLRRVRRPAGPGRGRPRSTGWRCCPATRCSCRPSTAAASPCSARSSRTVATGTWYTVSLTRRRLDHQRQRRRRPVGLRHQLGRR